MPHVWVPWEILTYDVGTLMSELLISWGEAYWRNWSRPDLKKYLRKWQFKARPGCWTIELQDGDVIFIKSVIPILVNLCRSHFKCFLCPSFLTNQNYNLMRKGSIAVSVFVDWLSLSNEKQIQLTIWWWAGLANLLQFQNSGYIWGLLSESWAVELTNNSTFSLILSSLLASFIACNMGLWKNDGGVKRCLWQNILQKDHWNQKEMN